MKNYILIVTVILTLFTSISIVAEIKSTGYSDRIFCHYRYHCHSEWTESKIDELDKHHSFWLGVTVLFQLQNIAVIVVLIILWLYSKEVCQKCDVEKKYEKNLNDPV